MYWQNLISSFAIKRFLIVCALSSLYSCSTAPESFKSESVSIRVGLLKKVDTTFILVDEVSEISKSNLLNNGDLGFGVLLSGRNDFEFVANVSVPKTEVHAEHVSEVRFGGDDVSLIFKRRARDGYGYVYLRLNEDDPLGNYFISIYIEDRLAFTGMLTIVE